MESCQRGGVYLAALALLCGAGCGNEFEPQPSAILSEPTAARQAESKIERSFQVPEKGRELAAGETNSNFSILKDALGKEFLFQGSLIIQVEAPQFTGLKSRVVRFEKHDDAVVMIESSIGQTYTPSIPQTLILATFPIQSETPSRVTINFNEGMSKIYVTGDWRGQDFEGGEYTPDILAVPVSSSAITSTTINDLNQLVIRQVAQLEVGFNHIPAEIRYYLEPYRSNPTFTPTSSKDFKSVGYFEVAPQIDGMKKPTILASKFDISKPITFAISANTPSDYRAAVADGIRYWNSVFGREVIKVVDAPEGVSAPDAALNIVQWIDWNLAGMAYADAQMDPRSGEILHAQVYMTSAFAFNSRAKARLLLRRLNETLSKKASAKTNQSAPGEILSTIRKSALCQHEPLFPLKASLTEMLATEATDAVFLRLSQDYVREVVAHEIGHTLGLRHNFAGSLGSTLSFERRADVIEEYLHRDTLAPDLITSSSVMEYQRIEESALTGARMRRVADPGLPYDRLAIARLYGLKAPTLSVPPLFCTDSHLELGMADCKQFDTGSSPVEFQAWSVEADIKSLPKLIVEDILSQRLGTPISDPRAPEEILLNPAVWGSIAYREQKALFLNLTRSARYLSVERRYRVISPLNQEQVEKAQFEYGAAEVDRLGGVSTLFPSVPGSRVREILSEAKRLLSDRSYREGVNPYTLEPYTLSEEEIRFYSEQLTMAEPKLRDQLALADLRSFVTDEAAYYMALFTGKSHQPTGPIVDSDVGDAMARVLLEKVREYLLARSGERGIEIAATVPVGSSVRPLSELILLPSLFESPTAPKKEAPQEPEAARVQILLPKYLYSIEVRALAAALLGRVRADSSHWAAAEKRKLSELWKGELKLVLNGKSLSDFQTEKLSRPARVWFTEAQMINRSIW